VHAWLAHLADAGINVAPKPVRIDTSAGVEEVTYIDGTVLSGGASPPYLWRDDTLTAVARLVRQFHDAAASFTPPADANWQETAAFPGGGDVICHNDLAPWNTVFTGECPVAFIDWDLAAPGPRCWDVSYAIIDNGRLQLIPDDIAVRSVFVLVDDDLRERLTAVLVDLLAFQREPHPAGVVGDDCAVLREHEDRDLSAA
jgi:Ser/Thr protein kinase RdoA (MazF antagonist)